MDILSTIIGTITSIVAYTLLLTGVYKLFSIGKDVAEIKKLLRDRTREHDAHPVNAVLRE